MKSNKYLYNSDEVPEIPADIILKRLELLNEHLSELLDVHYNKRELGKVRDVERAIEFWEKMREV